MSGDGMEGRRGMRIRGRIGPSAAAVNAEANTQEPNEPLAERGVAPGGGDTANNSSSK